ncbi:MAG: PrsW family intramembrane metalloprotease [Pelagibacterales bacterium]|nr:PrsW family intramembrane metalloprotease [Pelagibacterales bacterium]
MLLILAILPPFLIAYYVYQKDKYDKEPKSLIIKSFLFGCVAILPAIFLETIYNQSLFPNLFLYVFFGIALIEEGVKYFFLKNYMYKKKEFNEPMDGIVYAVMISLGFATVENISYVFKYEEQGFFVAITRMFTAIPLHAVCGVILGYFVGLSKFSDDKRPLLFKGLFLAVLTHALYNYFIFLGQGFIFSMIVLIVAIYYSKKAIDMHQQDSKIRH